MEKPLIFGPLDHLVGMVNVPQQLRRDVAVVMVTPGMLHSAGPFGLHVRLAGALAGCNILSFRFDLSGIGESLGVGSQGSSLGRAADEIQQAMTLLEQTYGIRQFVLFGLCSGADDSFHTASKDERVVGAFLMDGCAYRTSAFYLYRLTRHYLPRALSIWRWVNLVKQAFGRSPETPVSLQAGGDIREFPSREAAAVALRRLIARGVHMRFLYTGGASDDFNHLGQFARMFHDVEREEFVSCAHLPNVDHVAMLHEDRQAVIQDLLGWIGQHWPGRPHVQGAAMNGGAFAATPAWGIADANSFGAPA